MYFVLPFTPPTPGTYVAPGAWSYTEPGLVFMGFGMGFSFNGGTFTINSVNTSNFAGLEYDLSWTQDYYGIPLSGHARFTLGDSDPPVVTVPDSQFAAATSAAGATLDYTVTAHDAVDGPVPVTCTPLSGTVFAVGETTVTCRASDSAGNTRTATFTVTVLGAAAQLSGLVSVVIGVGPGTSFADKLRAAEGALAAGDIREACSILAAFAHQVSAQSGKIDPQTSAALISATTQIRTVVGCSP